MAPPLSNAHERRPRWIHHRGLIVWGGSDSGPDLAPREVRKAVAAELELGFKGDPSNDGIIPGCEAEAQS